MAASSALEAHVKHPDHRPSLSLAQHMLQQAQATADAMKALPHTSMTSYDEHIRTIAMYLLKMVRLSMHIAACSKFMTHTWLMVHQ